MSILVDAAIWRWRGQLWAHLISDKSHRELHVFATSIGKKRVGFQGDHYDIHADDRTRAIESGATPVSSRELVRSLVRSGLRRRGVARTVDWSFDIEDSIESINDLSALLDGFCDDPVGSAIFRAVRDVTTTAGLHGGPIEVLTLRGSKDMALVLSAPADLWERRPDVAHLDFDEAYVSQAGDIVSLEVLAGPANSR